MPSPSPSPSPSYEHTLVDILVTEQDIITGIRHHCRKCPVALAIRRVLKNDFTVNVGSVGEVLIHPEVFPSIRHPLPPYYEAQVVRLTLPTTAVSFIHLFDKGYPVGPILFQIEIPNKVLKASVVNHD